jgi:hypothetical protein
MKVERIGARGFEQNVIGLVAKLLHGHDELNGEARIFRAQENFDLKFATLQQG